MKIFVTGGAGFIASNFIRHVLSAHKGYQIVNYDKLTYAGNLANLEEVAENPNYSFVKGDICDAAALEAAMHECDSVSTLPPSRTWIEASTSPRASSRPTLQELSS